MQPEAPARGVRTGAGDCTSAPSASLVHFLGARAVAVGASREQRAGEVPESRRYWSLREVVAAGRAQPFEGAPEDAADALHDLLLRAVRGQMANDIAQAAYGSSSLPVRASHTRQ